MSAGVAEAHGPEADHQDTDFFAHDTTLAVLPSPLLRGGAGGIGASLRGRRAKPPSFLSKPFQIRRFFFQGFPKIPLAVLGDFKGLQGL